MTHKLKVFGTLISWKGNQSRAIAATTSQKRFAELIGTSLGYVRDYASETGNAEEIHTAMSQAETVFVQCKTCQCWHRKDD